jgi:hypothetical protein
MALFQEQVSARSSGMIVSIMIERAAVKLPKFSQQLAIERSLRRFSRNPIISILKYTSGSITASSSASSCFLVPTHVVQFISQPVQSIGVKGRSLAGLEAARQHPPAVEATDSRFGCHGGEVGGGEHRQSACAVPA